MEGVLCTCSLMFFLLISSAVNVSQGFFSEDFPFSISTVQENAPSPSPESPMVSPSYPPGGSINSEDPNSTDSHRQRGMPRKPRTNGLLLSNPVKKGLNNGKMAGLVLVSIAGGLQVVVLTYLLVKRRQMLRVVEKYEV